MPLNSIHINHLKLVVGDRVRVVLPPFLSTFSATGVVTYIGKYGATVLLKDGTEQGYPFRDLVRE